MGAIRAALDMAAKRGSTAGNNGIHDTQLSRAHMPGIGGPPFLAAAAEDIRHLQR
jgi:hypothetical protein